MIYKITLKDEPRHEFLVGFEYADDYRDKLEEARWEADDISQYPRGSYVLKYHNEILARGKPTLGKLGYHIDSLIQADKFRLQSEVPHSRAWYDKLTYRIS